MPEKRKSKKDKENHKEQTDKKSKVVQIDDKQNNQEKKKNLSQSKPSSKTSSDNHLKSSPVIDIPKIQGFSQLLIPSANQLQAIEELKENNIQAADGSMISSFSEIDPEEEV